MNRQTRTYTTKHGTAFAIRTRHNTYLTSLVYDVVEVLETGRVIRLDRSTSPWLACPACGCENISFDTLGDATCCLANHAMNDCPRTEQAPMPADQYHPSHDAIVTADDIRQDRNADNAEGHAEAHAIDCECDECRRAQYPTAEHFAAFTCKDCGTHIEWGMHYCPACAPKAAVAWNARLAARAAAIVTKAETEQETVIRVSDGLRDTMARCEKQTERPFIDCVRAAVLAGACAFALCLTGTPASASEVYHTGQSVIINGSSCQVTHAWEDGSAVAHCRNHTVWTFDADGSPTHTPQTWYRVKHTHNDHNSYGR